MYDDRHGIFGIERTSRRLELDLAGIRHEPTQVERVMQVLEIASISARSPQAKGRIELLFGSFQDRLVSELRLAGICTRDAASEFLAAITVTLTSRTTGPLT